MIEPPVWLETCLLGLFVVFIVITVVGNILIILAVVTTRRLRTVTNCFVMSLAVADWLVGIFVMPIAVAVHIEKGKSEFSETLCEVWVSSDVCLCTASILSLCAISIDRYFAVTQPIKYTRRRRSRRLALFMILFVWLLSIAITCPPLLWYSKISPGDCEYSQDKGYVIFSAMGSFFVPLTVMVYVYIRIYCVISRRHNKLETLNAARTHVRWPLHTVKSKRKTGNIQDEDLERGSSESEEVGTSMMNQQQFAADRFNNITSRVSSFRRESKTAQTLSVVVGGFIACWLPFFIVYLMIPFLPKETIPEVVIKLLTWLGWLNSAINPFIYAFYSPEFRVAFWRLTLKHFCGQNVCRPSGYNSRVSVQMRDSGIFTTRP